MRRFFLVPFHGAAGDGGKKECLPTLEVGGPPGVRRAAVRAGKAFRVGMARQRLVSLCLALALLALGDARVIRKEPDEQRLIGWLGEVPREASGGALGRKHGPKDGGTNDASSSDVLMRDVDELTTRAFESTSTPNAVDVDPSSFDLETDPRVERLSDSPRAYLFRGFLTPEECDHLVVVGEPHLTRSTVVGGAEKTTASDGLTNDVRTSFGTFIPKAYDDVFDGVERRVAAFSGLPYENQEQLQLLRYRDGQEYKDHSDGLSSPNGGKRVATVLMFLREPSAGGETSFPTATPRASVKARAERAFANGELSACAWRDGRGMAVRPRQGDAVLFFSFSQNEESGAFERADPASTHASCPTSGGTKWTATKWIHEREFTTGVWREPRCADTVAACEEWARRGECAKNPGFMLGAETSGACVRSCCGDDDDVATPTNLSAWQTEFCASCADTSWPRRFAEMRANVSVLHAR